MNIEEFKALTPYQQEVILILQKILKAVQIGE
jgi:hypothetical protein